ncbi:MAG: septum formation initiator [Chitinophagia bacterium]|nr:septum formation initiator [Chitinophagia bacterium]
MPDLKDNKIVKALTNKRVIFWGIVPLCFVVWMLFGDENDLFTMRKRREHIAKLQSNVAYLDAAIKETKERREALETDYYALEQYSRETYFMKRKNEDVYVVQEDTAK